MKGYLNTDDAAAHLREKHSRRCVSAYLSKLRTIGGGPSFYKNANLVFYKIPDLDDWAINTPMRRARR